MIHNQYLKREKKEGRGNDSCHFSDQYVDQVVTKSYFQAKLKLQYQLNIV